MMKILMMMKMTTMTNVRVMAEGDIRGTYCCCKGNAPQLVRLAVNGFGKTCRARHKSEVACDKSPQAMRCTFALGSSAAAQTPPTKSAIAAGYLQQKQLLLHFKHHHHYHHHHHQNHHQHLRRGCCFRRPQIQPQTLVITPPTFSSAIASATC